MTIPQLFLLTTVWALFAGIVCLLKKNNGLIDIFWSLGFICVSAWTFQSESIFLVPRLLLNWLVWIWGLRLAGYLFLRNWSKPEDFRYAEMRKGWGKHWVLSSIFKVYVLQGVLLGVIAFPIYWFNTHDVHPEFLTGIAWPLVFIFGAALSFFGIAVEAVADRQKSVFKKDPAHHGKICNVGLWRYSRHPNYLGEILMWWGVGVACLVFEQGYFGLIGPLGITFLLFKVSGVPMLEAKKKDDPAFQEYVKTTGAIFPRF